MYGEISYAQNCKIFLLMWRISDLWNIIWRYYVKLLIFDFFLPRHVHVYTSYQDLWNLKSMNGYTSEIRNTINLSFVLSPSFLFVRLSYLKFKYRCLFLEIFLTMVFLTIFQLRCEIMWSMSYSTAVTTSLQIYTPFFMASLQIYT